MRVGRLGYALGVFESRITMNISFVECSEKNVQSKRKIPIRAEHIRSIEACYLRGANSEFIQVHLSSHPIDCG